VRFPRDSAGLTDLFVALKANGVRVVIVENATRVARDLMVSEIILAEFRKLGVKVISADGGVDLTLGNDDPTGKLVRQILAAVLALCGSPLAGTLAAGATSPVIDRFALVTRHNLHFQEPRPENVLTLGNGNFAFTTDLPGLQTFPAFHHQGIPLTTMANWAWHSYPNPNRYSLKDVGRPLQVRGKTQLYPVVKVFLLPLDIPGVPGHSSSAFAVDINVPAWLSSRCWAGNPESDRRLAYD